MNESIMTIRNDGNTPVYFEKHGQETIVLKPGDCISLKEGWTVRTEEDPAQLSITETQETR